MYIYINIALDAKQIIYNGRKEKYKYIKLQSYVKHKKFRRKEIERERGRNNS